MSLLGSNSDYLCSFSLCAQETVKEPHLALWDSATYRRQFPQSPPLFFCLVGFYLIPSYLCRTSLFPLRDASLPLNNRLPEMYSKLMSSLLGRAHKSKSDLSSQHCQQQPGPAHHGFHLPPDGGGGGDDGGGPPSDPPIGRSTVAPAGHALLLDDCQLIDHAPCARCCSTQSDNYEVPDMRQHFALSWNVRVSHFLIFFKFFHRNQDDFSNVPLYFLFFFVNFLNFTESYRKGNNPYRTI